MIRKILHRFGLMAAIAAPILAGGCSDAPDDSREEPRKGVSAKVSFSISSRALGQGTRADGTPLDPVSDNEKIKDWWLVFVDKSNNVSKILTRTEAVGTSTTAVEQETFECTLPTGTYDIYAFANITTTELTAASGLTFTEGATLPNNVMSSVWNGLNSSDGRVEAIDETRNDLYSGYNAAVNTVSTNNMNLWDATATGKPIPMTGFLSGVRIENTIEEKFAIEVVRMVAKVELQILNPGNTDVAITDVAFSPVTVTPVSLFPSYSVLGEIGYTPLENAQYARLKHSMPEATTVEGNGASAYSFYMKESISYDKDNRPLGGFSVWLNVRYDEYLSEFLQSNPTQDIRGYINRNDWIRIPIRLSQFDVNVEAVFYPPIGGYPALMEEIDPIDGSRSFNFGTPGEFAIMPYITDKMTDKPVPYQRFQVEVDEIRYSAKTAGNWKTPDWISASLIYSSDATETVDANKGIFKRMPVNVEAGSNYLPYEILGELNEKEGIARVMLKVKVYDGNYTPGAAPKRIYTRTVYIIRDNTGGNN